MGVCQKSLNVRRRVHNSQNPCSEREAHRENPAMVILVELRQGDLHTTANAEMQPLRQWKAAQNQSRGEENLLLAVERSARPERRVLLDHRPYFALDPVINLGIKENRAAQEIRPRGREIGADCALNVPWPKALRGCKSGSQDGVPQPVRRSARRERAAKKESHKVVALAFSCGKCAELHLPREISKSIQSLRLVHEVARRKYSHLQARCRDDFQTS